MEVQFIASVAPIVRDSKAARAFYADALGLSFEGGEADYVYTQKLDGAKHFGLWPLSEAATACFGTTEWPSEIPVPHASIEFEGADVAGAAARADLRRGGAGDHRDHPGHERGHDGDVRHFEGAERARAGLLRDRAGHARRHEDRQRHRGDDLRGDSSGRRDGHEDGDPRD